MTFFLMVNTDLITFHFATVDMCEPEPNPVMAGAGGGTKKRAMSDKSSVFSLLGSSSCDQCPCQNEVHPEQCLI